MQITEKIKSKTRSRKVIIPGRSHFKWQGGAETLMWFNFGPGKWGEK